MEHDRVILDLLARVRVSQSLFPSESSQVKDTTTTTTLLLTPKPSRRAEAFEKLPGKTIQISKDAGGHLGIKFDDQLKVIAVSPWAKKFGIIPGQTLLVCNGTSKLDETSGFRLSEPFHSQLYDLSSNPNRTQLTARLLGICFSSVFYV